MSELLPPAYQASFRAAFELEGQHQRFARFAGAGNFRIKARTLAVVFDALRKVVRRVFET